MDTKIISSGKQHNTCVLYPGMNSYTNEFIVQEACRIINKGPFHLKRLIRKNITSLLRKDESSNSVIRHIALSCSSRYHNIILDHILLYSNKNKEGVRVSDIIYTFGDKKTKQRIEKNPSTYGVPKNLFDVKRPAASAALPSKELRMVAEGQGA